MLCEKWDTYSGKWDMQAGPTWASRAHAKRRPLGSAGLGRTLRALGAAASGGAAVERQWPTCAFLTGHGPGPPAVDEF